MEVQWVEQKHWFCCVGMRIEKLYVPLMHKCGRFHYS